MWTSLTPRHPWYCCGTIVSGGTGLPEYRYKLPLANALLSGSCVRMNPMPGAGSVSDFAIFDGVDSGTPSIPFLCARSRTFGQGGGLLGSRFSGLFMACFTAYE